MSQKLIFTHEAGVNVTGTTDETEVLSFPVPHQIRNGTAIHIASYWDIVSNIAFTTFTFRLYLNGCPDCPHEISNSPIDYSADAVRPSYGASQAGLLDCWFWFGNPLDRTDEQTRFQTMSGSMTWLWGKSTSWVAASNNMQGRTYLGYTQNNSSTYDWLGATDLTMTLESSVAGNSIDLTQCYIEWITTNRLRQPINLSVYKTSTGWDYPRAKRKRAPTSAGLRPGLLL